MSGARGAVRDLDVWLTPFLDVLGRKTRRIWAPLYLRGLLGPGERKSLQPMAARLGLSGHDQLQHFIASPAWDDGPVDGVGAASGPTGWRGGCVSCHRRHGFVEEGHAATPRSRLRGDPGYRSAWRASIAVNSASGPTAKP